MSILNMESRLHIRFYQHFYDTLDLILIQKDVKHQKLHLPLDFGNKTAFYSLKYYF